MGVEEICKMPCNLHGVLSNKIEILEKSSGEHSELRADIDRRVKMTTFQWLTGGMCVLLLSFGSYIVNSQSQIEQTLQATSKDLAVIAERTKSINVQIQTHSKYIEKMQERLEDHIDTHKNTSR